MISRLTPEFALRGDVDGTLRNVEPIRNADVTNSALIYCRDDGDDR